MHSIIFGDNQFFGINHWSEDKAQQQAEKFQNLSAIIEVLDAAYDAGIRGFMFNTHDRVADICEHFRANRTRYPGLTLYPSLPYAHKYANLVNEKGLAEALKESLLRGSSAGQIMGSLLRGGKSIVTQDLIEAMKLLVDIELKMFRGLEIQAVFLQNIVTDLLVGLGTKEVFYEFYTHVKKRYCVEAGFNTMNMPMVAKCLAESGVAQPYICAAINKGSYLVNPSLVDVKHLMHKPNFKPIAMSIFASGSIRTKEAIEFILKMGDIQIVFGASSKAHVESTVRLICELRTANGYDTKNSIKD